MNKLKEIRSRANLKQSELASLAGVERQSINMYERGDTLPRVDSALAIAAILGVKVEDIWPAPEIETVEVVTQVRRIKR